MIFQMFTALTIALSAHAYIPTSIFIFERTAANHGKGSYAIEADVIFTDGVEKFVVKEGWLINDQNDMRVTAWGDGFKIYKVFKGSRTHWLDADNRMRVDEANDFFMLPLMMKEPLELKRLFVKWGALPPEILKEKKPLKDLKDVKHDPEPWVRLGRVGGAVCYAYGKPSPADGPPAPGLWIEQDAFIIRKMRLPSGAEFIGNNYGAYSKNLWFPRSQIINFGANSVTVRVTRVTGLEMNADQRRQLDPAILRTRQDSAAVWPKSSLAPVLQEFYKRFR